MAGRLSALRCSPSQSMFHISPVARLTTIWKRESFHPDGPMNRMPVMGAAPRVMQGLNMHKVVVYRWIPFFKTREKAYSAYKYPERNMQPIFDAMSPEELVTYYDVSNYQSKWSKAEIMRIWGIRYLRIFAHALVYPTIIAICLTCYFIPSNRFEAIEYYMPAGEYYENYVWHDFGKFINRHAYQQYLEARRAKKWGRNPDVDPVDYIPPEYRSDRQKRARGELPPLPEGETELDIPYFEEE